ncbi:MAG: PLP-dependent aminotransferase family protein [Erysipelotrichaceae bacterium]|nr:PLP-dependent aminotransferase family protein [Erysipelotrichaceae bacterium]
MDNKFSYRINNAKASAIREILKLMNDPEMISFGGGNPASESFPIAKLAQISNRLMQEEPLRVLEYGITEGDPKLNAELSKFMNRDFLNVLESDSVMITSGSQQIMDLVGRALINDGDVVISENPSFLGALNAFKVNGAKVKGVTMEDDGLNLSELEETLKTTENVKLIYLIPNFQNPTGITTSLEKRKAILDLAINYDVLILEDNPYGEIRFANEHIPSIKSLDTTNYVIYAASLSKIVAPGMRIAAMVATPELLSKCVVAKQSSDVHTNAWAQAMMAEFLATTDIDAHLKSICAIYEQKAKLMLDKMAQTFAQDVKWTHIEGGMFIWVTLPERLDMQRFVKEALKHKVAVVPGNAFLDDDTRPCNSFRMNFSKPTMEQIIQGVAILGELTKEQNHD